jgi:hypothetical protein
MPEKNPTPHPSLERDSKNRPDEQSHFLPTILEPHDVRLARDHEKSPTALFDDLLNSKITPPNLPFTSSRILALAVCLSFLIKTAAGGCVAVCDGGANSISLRPNAVTTSGGTTIANDLTTTMTTAYFNPIVTKPATGAWYIRGLCKWTTFGNCATGVAPLVSAYTVSISPAACQNLLWWDAACTQPCTASKSVADGVAPLTISAKVTNIAEAVTTHSCNLVISW